MTQFINIKITTEADANINLKDNYKFNSSTLVFNSSLFILTIKSSLLEKKKVVSDFFTIFTKIFSNEFYTLKKNYKYSVTKFSDKTLY